MLKFRIATSAAVLAWATALHAADPAPIAPAAQGSELAPLPPSAPLAPVAPLPGDPTLAPALEAAPSAPEPAKPAAASAPDRLGIGKLGGFFQPSALIQIWGVGDKRDDYRLDTTFRLRRVEVRVKGEVVPKLVSYYVGFDVAKTPGFTNAPTTVSVPSADPAAAPTNVSVPNYTLGPDRSVLQDVFITYQSSFADVAVGQFKIPVSLEGLWSSSKLMFPERNRVTEAYGDRRDIGIRIDKKIGDYFYYYAGIFNGQGLNVTDVDRPKDVGLRLEAYPIPGLTIGGVAYGTAFGRDKAVRDRFEGDLRYEGQGLIVQGEYIHAVTGARGRRLTGQGVYGAAGYTILDLLQPVFRVGVLDSNIDNRTPPTTVAESAPLRFIEGGLNYFVQGNDAKLSLSVSSFDQVHGPDLLEVLLQTQIAF